MVTQTARPLPDPPRPSSSASSPASPSAPSPALAGAGVPGTCTSVTESHSSSTAAGHRRTAASALRTSVHSTTHTRSAHLGKNRTQHISSSQRPASRPPASSPAAPAPPPPHPSPAPPAVAVEAAPDPAHTPPAPDPAHPADAAPRAALPSTNSLLQAQAVAVAQTTPAAASHPPHTTAQTGVARTVSPHSAVAAEIGIRFPLHSCQVTPSTSLVVLTLVRTHGRCSTRWVHTWRQRGLTGAHWKLWGGLTPLRGRPLECTSQYRDIVSMPAFFCMASARQRVRWLRWPVFPPRGSVLTLFSIAVHPIAHIRRRTMACR